MFKLIKSGAGVYIDVGGANIQIVHYFENGYLWSKIVDRHGH